MPLASIVVTDTSNRSVGVFGGVLGYTLRCRNPGNQILCAASPYNLAVDLLATTICDDKPIVRRWSLMPHLRVMRGSDQSDLLTMDLEPANSADKQTVLVYPDLCLTRFVVRHRMMDAQEMALSCLRTTALPEISGV